MFVGEEKENLCPAAFSSLNFTFQALMNKEPRAVAPRPTGLFGVTGSPSILGLHSAGAHHAPAAEGFEAGEEGGGEKDDCSPNGGFPEDDPSHQTSQGDAATNDPPGAADVWGEKLHDLLRVK